ncbi:gluconate oxidoreductase [Xylona heveae TC161]|uniref:Gluconate oxidoreductase n=1 Tax=Xylona heveae (strain CBS 132557 / TC161) TaxID=1328760 RepID=A0A165J732_XYLHT|nr:gluconate oxidoreductase [Xylona heveae TC161]KZF25828.1 gluconate oxidoreductase [Xylona heveae TC161]
MSLDRFSLKGRTALVTGGAWGCGLAFSQGLAEAGADIAIFDVVPPAEGLLAIQNKYGIKIKSYRVDVSDLKSLQEGFAEFSKDFGNKLDVCVPCAGINRNLSFLDTPWEEHQKLLDVNVLGVYYTAQMAARQMIANGTKKGSIIMVASIASYRAIRGQMSSAYCGTKGAVRAMCAPIAAELSQYGIRVNTISPGYVRTEMTAPFPHLLESWKEEIMNNRVAEPEDLQGACVFLASDASSYMTGQDVLIDGGVTRW